MQNPRHCGLSMLLACLPLQLWSPLALGAVPPLASEAESHTATAAPNIDDVNPESSVPERAISNRDPLAAGYLLMELVQRAEQSLEQHDWPRAARYYRAVAKAVPHRATAYAKLCQIYRAMDRADQALAACRKAIGLEGGQLGDYLGYASLLLDRTPEGTPLPTADVEELDSVFQHLESQNAAGPELQVVKCRLGARLEDPVRLSACVEQLKQKLPGDAVTAGFEFALDLLRSDYTQARAVIDRARQAGLPADALSLMTGELETRQRQSRASIASRLVVGCALPAALVAVLFGLRRRRRQTAAARA